MENVKNNKGQTTVECLLVVPMILVLIIGSVMLYITSYQGSKRIMAEVRKGILERDSVNVEYEISYLHMKYKKSIVLPVNSLNGQKLQEFVMYAFDILEQVKDETE